MKGKKSAVLFAVVIVFSIAAAACGQKAASPAALKPAGGLEIHATDIIKAERPEKNPDYAKNRKDTFIIGIETPEGVFNPFYEESSYDHYITESIFDTLCDIDSEGTPIPGAAEKWEISSDGLEYTFHLKKNLKFTDGTPVTAFDVAFFYYVILDPSYDGYQDGISIGLKGWQAYNKGTSLTIEGIQVIDQETIKFILEKPYAPAIYKFASTPLMPKAYYGKDYKQGNTDPIKKLNGKPLGSGQYKFVKYKEGIETDLVANETYRKGTPKIKNLVYKCTDGHIKIQRLISGENDMDEIIVNANNIQELKSAGFLNMQMYPSNGYGYIGMNIALPQFNDKKVRQALTYGLNRKRIVNIIYKGYADVCNEPESKISWAYNTDINEYEYNQEKAAELLDEAGWKKGSDGIRERNGNKFEIHFSAACPNPINDAIIQTAKSDYEKLGIKFIAYEMEFDAVKRIIDEGKAEMFFMFLGLTAEPDCTPVFKTKGDQNRMNYSNKKVDELLEQGLKTIGEEDRKIIYKELFKEINDDCPYIFLYQKKDMWAINDRIKNINITPYRDFTNDLWQAEVR